MKYSNEIIRIIEAGSQLNPLKVQSYTKLLLDKLHNDGEVRLAERIEKIFSGDSGTNLKLSNINLTPLPVDKESRLSLADENLYRPGDIEVFLSKTTEEQVGEFIAYIKAADLFSNKGVSISPSLLIYGPPGVGKTELARFIASQLQLPLLTARCDALISSYLGSTSKNIRTLFEHASSRPCILFLDEFDALAKQRDDNRENGELKRVVVSLLQNIDVISDDVVVIAATNHEHLLDPAVWRRFAYKVHMKAPGSEVRKKLWQEATHNMLSASDLRLIVDISKGMSGSDIKNIGLDLIRQALISEKEIIDLNTALKKIMHFRLPDITFDKTEDGFNRSVFNLRHYNNKVFTLRRLAEMFGVSHSSIKNIIERLK